MIGKQSMKNLLFFSRYVRPYSFFYVFTLVSMLVQAGLALVQPIFYKELVDDVLNAANPADHINDFIRIVMILAGIRISVIGLSMISTVFKTKVSTSATNALEFDVMNKLHRLPIKYHDRHPTGDIFPRLYNDPPQILNFYLTFLPQLVISIVKAIIVFFVILFNLWWAGLLALLPVLPMWIISKYNVRYFKELSDKQFIKHQRLYNRVLDMIHGIRIVRIYQKEKAEMKRFKTIQSDLRDLQIQSSVRSAWMSPLISNVGRLGGFIVFLAGSARLLNIIEFGDKEFTLGTLFMVLSYVWQLAGPVTNIANFSGEYGAIRAAAKRLSDLLSEEEIVPRITASTLQSDETALAFQNVEFSYDPGKKTLSDLSFRINSGENIGIVGPSGSGKTTILNLICGFYTADSGQVYVSDQSQRSDGVSTLSLAMQSGDLFQGTVRENLAYANPGVSDDEINSVLDLVEARAFVHGMTNGLDTQVGEGSNIISTGQTQRLALARSILAGSPVLILDEATSGVDLWSEQRIFTRLLQKCKNQTIICISHRLHLMKLMDRVFVIRDGKLVHSGTHDYLLENDDFYLSSWDFKDFDGNRQ